MHELFSKYQNKIIDGKAIANGILQDVKNKVLGMHPKPKLAIVLASFDESSHKYVELKMKKAESVGIGTILHHFGEEITKDQIIQEIKKFKHNEAVSGVLLQLPLYSHLNDYTAEIVNAIDPTKDSDGLTAIQQGSCAHLIENSVLPATVEAVLECLNECVREDLSWKNIIQNRGKLETFYGKNILIINDSNLIGRPLAMLLSNLRGTVTIANSGTKNLKELCLQSDIIISATGETNIIDHEMIKQDVILIDVTSVSKNGEVLGDFIYSEELLKKCSYFTPVPGGVGPITVACLLRNLVS